MVSKNLFRSYFKIAWKITLFIGLLWIASRAGDWVIGQLTPNLTPSTEPALHRFIMIAISIYVLLMMLPFVPGIEIGLGMIAMFGPKIAFLVYCGTVLALVLSFLIGRYLPQDAIIELFETLHLKRAGNLLRQLKDRETDGRIEFLLHNGPKRFLPFLLRHRFLALMVALNLPGNALIGGGGGICMVAGFSRLFPILKFILAVAIAVSPIPLFIFLTGT